MPDRAPAPPPSRLVTDVIRWFDRNERPLPWRRTSPWGVLVSEFMLQQTPVDRVLPVWTVWLERWPEPAALAEASLAEVLRAWGRLGYPRRARNLHRTAGLLVEQHGGEVPSADAALRALPGVGEYTSAAIRAFAFGQRAVVLDTNVRRVIARAVVGEAAPPAHLTRGERERADLLWPVRDTRSARWSAGVMELGALVCTARTPDCGRCPVARQCAWLAAGQPAAMEPARRQAQYEGSDRQVRGRIMALLRATAGPAGAAEVATTWPDDEQRNRALAGLLADGLAVSGPRGYSLPT